MRTLRRYLATEIMAATALVIVALVMLFAFFDLVEQIKDLGRGAYNMRRILIYMLLSLPDHIYALFPVAALIGTLFALAQLVAGSEYTVMRTSGVSTTRFAAALASVGLLFAALTFLFGEFIAPPAQQLAQRLPREFLPPIAEQALPRRGQELERAVEIRPREQHLRPLVGVPGADVDGEREIERAIRGFGDLHGFHPRSLCAGRFTICTASHIASI